MIVYRRVIIIFRNKECEVSEIINKLSLKTFIINIKNLTQKNI